MKETTNKSPIIFIKDLLLIGTKFITLIVCIYYIGLYQEYEVQLGWARNLLPTAVTGFLDNTIGFTGTTVLLIPSTVIILSFLMQHHLLNLISGLFGIFGVLFSITRGLIKVNLGEVHNFGLFQVRHIATLEKKREWFLFEAKRYSEEICSNIQEKLLYIQKHFTKQDFITYDYNLSNLSTLTEVKKYAVDVVTDLIKEFERLPTTTHWYHRMGNFVYDTATNPKFLIVIGITFFVAGVGYGIIKYFGSSGPSTLDNLKTQAELGKETVETVQTVNNATSTLNTATGILSSQVEANTAQCVKLASNVLTLDKKLIQLNTSNVQISDSILLNTEKFLNLQENFNKLVVLLKDHLPLKNTKEIQKALGELITN